MIRAITIAASLALAAMPVSVLAQAGVQTDPAPVPHISGTRLDVVATGEAARVPDIAQISTGVTVLAPTATEAIAQNATRMNRVIAALRRAGIAERDIHTSTLSLQPEYRYVENQSPMLTGYRATNEISVRYRKIATSGAILDALVAEGANQINGPALTIDNPEAAMDEARQNAITKARARAQLYAQAIGKKVGRILLIDETGGAVHPDKIVLTAGMARSAEMVQTSIVPGEQTISVTIFVSFELE